MDRATWLKEMRRKYEEQYAVLWAPLYGERKGLYNNAIHQQFIREFLNLLPQKSRILDAACRAGRYTHPNRCHSFLLRLWQIDHKEEKIWHVSLEGLYSSEIHRFCEPERFD